ncbi:actin depolymerizing protein [Mycena vitilis]|nr:actin depolymerizing protein [Mycena vitilis]
MSSNSGIGVSTQLSDAFSAAIKDGTTRFIKVSIRDESLAYDGSVDIKGTLQYDLDNLLQFRPGGPLDEIQHDGSQIESDKITNKITLYHDIPAYLLAKLDDPPSEWLFIPYIPESAHIRNRMLYSSSQAPLRKALGASLFSDSMDARSKDELTAQAYAAHRRHVLAPPPLSAREREMADVLAAERQAGNVDAYQGSGARNSPIANTISMPWDTKLEQAVKALGEGDDTALVIATIKEEKLLLHWDSREQTSPAIPADDVGNRLPPREPSYAFFAWKHAPSRRDIVSIYSCPSSMPRTPLNMKQGMVYATGYNAFYMAAQALLKDSPTQLLKRKLETGTPTEIDEAFLRSELDLSSSEDAPQARTSTLSADGGKSFARPPRPKRR